MYDTNKKYENLVQQVNVLYVMKRELLIKKEHLTSQQEEALKIVDTLPKVGVILNSLYDKVAGKIIKACEKAITDATHEIIGDNTNIGMDVSTKNGQIHVDVGSAIYTSNDNRILRSIVDGEGGGLTNVVCFSLRAIITSRSGQRKFMVIDEPDCWLDSSKVNPFFNIIHKMAIDGGFQIIALTHHDTSEFEDRANILTLSREDKDSPVKLEVSGHIDTSLPTDNIITSIRLENFGGHKDLTFPLSAGLNFIRGKSNIGKSRLLRALRCVILNDGNDGDISSFAIDEKTHNISSYCAVEITFNGGKTLYWKRKKSGSPKEVWTLKDNNGDIVKLSDGTICDMDKNGKDWVSSSEVLNIKPSEFSNNKLCSQLHTQKMPMFAINENGNVIASLLSIGEDAGILRKMISIAREKENEAKQELKRINKNLDEISVDLMKYSKLEKLREMVNRLSELKANYEEMEDVLDNINTNYNNYMKSKEKIEKAKKFISLIPNIPDFLKINRIGVLYNEYKKSEKQVSLLKGFISLIPSIPTFNNTSDISRIYFDYKKSEKQVLLGKKFIEMVDNIKIPKNISLNTISNLYKGYMESKEKIEKAKKFISLIPDVPFINVNISKVSKITDEYIDSCSKIEEYEKEISDIDALIEKNQIKLDNLKKQYKICPTCGNSFK